MEPLRYIQTIENGRIVIENLEAYQGKKVLIAVVPLDETKADNAGKAPKTVRGKLKRYANPDLIVKEKQVWEKALKEGIR